MYAYSAKGESFRIPSLQEMGHLKPRYRPEGLVNPYKSTEEEDGTFSHSLGQEEQAFEAGADAMFETLWKMAEDSPTGIFFLDSNTHQAYAKISDIPKD